MANTVQSNKQFSYELTDRRIELVIGNLLRAGVLLAALVVLIGGIFYLCHQGNRPSGVSRLPRHSRSAQNCFRNLRWAINLRDQGIIQLGLLLLIATPVARVLFSLLAFAVQRDRPYIAMTLIVLSILLYSLFGGVHI